MKESIKFAVFLCVFFIVFQSKSQKPPQNENSEGENYAKVTSTAPIDIGSRLELFVDDYLIDRLIGGATLQLHHPEPKEVVVTHDAPWEGNGCGYHSIFQDGDTYKMYYKAWQHEHASKAPTHSIYCCYAESDDGIHWERPNLGVHEFENSRDNNIVFIRGLMDGVNADAGHPAVFKDENPDVEPNALYKAIIRTVKPTKGLLVFKSPDGIHWSSLTKTPVITDGAFDSQNLAFWDKTQNEYRAYWRAFVEVPEGTDTLTHQDVVPGSIRAIRTARSKDMINWYDQKDLAYVDSPHEHLYTNAIKPYYRAPHLFIGFPVRYVDRGWSGTMKALPELKNREWRSSIRERYGTVLTEGLFMASRDGVNFKRWNEAFLRPGIERKGTWNYGHQYIGWSVVETKSALEGAPNELSLYAVEDYWTGTSCNLRRYTLRIDGFVSVNASMDGGELITKPLIFSGKNLMINFSSSAAGDVKVELQDENGDPIPGFTLGECPPVFGDSLERIVKWGKDSDLSSLAGKPVKLRFVLKDADLFSFRFE